MTYFAANGQQLGTQQPPQASANGLGRSSFPQASANGMGRYGMIGMMPPQAQAGIGADMTPSGIPEGPMTAWRDGVFGARRQPEPFGDQLYPPWRDGIFGPSLGQTNGGPTLTFSGDAVTETKAALNLLVGSYTPTPGTAYDAATEAAYVTWVEEQTPGYPDKTVLYKMVGSRRFPSARGIYVLMNAARVAWAASEGDQESYARVESWYPTLWAFNQAFEGADYHGSIIVPETSTNGQGTVKASTVALIGVGAIGVGLLAVMLRPKRRR